MGLAGVMVRKFRLLSYRQLLFGFRKKSGDLSPMEAMTLHIVRLLGHPTISEFASFFGISQPNATYKVKSLVKKGYLKKIKSKSDRREFRLAVDERYEHLHGVSDPFLESLAEQLQNRFTAEQIETANQVLNYAYKIAQQEEDK